MPENGTHIFIHHYGDGTSIFHFGMIICMILIAVILLMLTILLCVALYVVVCSKKSSRRKIKPLKHVSRYRDNLAFKNSIDGTSCNDVDIASTSMQDLGADVNSNAQSIPMRDFKKHSKTNVVDDESSESSAGLYDVLFPDNRDSEVTYEPPTRLVTFAGEVFASGGNNSRRDSNAGPSTSRHNCDDASSLEWDYFQQDSHVASTHFGDESKKELRRVFWV